MSFAKLSRVGAPGIIWKAIVFGSALSRSPDRSCWTRSVAEFGMRKAKAATISRSLLGWMLLSTNFPASIWAI